MKLDIGCGKTVAKGHVGLDIKDFGQRLVFDVRDGGIPQGPWEEIRAAHFIEHLTQDEAINFLNDCWMACEKLYLVVPHKESENSWILTHKTFYTEATFRHLERDGIRKSYGISNWKINKMVTNSRHDIHVWMEPDEQKS